MNFTKLYIPLFAATIGLSLASCGGGKTDSNGSEDSLSGQIRIDGSSTVYPISEAMAEEFRTEAPKVDITVGLSGTGGGFKKFGRGEIDINNASRPIKKEEMETAAANNIHFAEVTVAYDGLSVVVNPQNTWVNDITVAELKKIWEPEAQGKIKRWNQIRPDWPNEEIHLFGAGVESGTYDYFTEAIVGKSHSSRGDYTASEDDNVLVQGIQNDKFSLGFFGFAYYDQNKDKLKIVPVDDENDENGKGPIAPTIETVKDKSYAPLSRPLFIYVTSKAAARPEVQKFVDFYIDNAPVLTQEVGFIPLTDQEYKEQKEKFKAFSDSTSKQ